jgi:hypothetical protein
MAVAALKCAPSQAKSKMPRCRMHFAASLRPSAGTNPHAWRRSRPAYRTMPARRMALLRHAAAEHTHTAARAALFTAAVIHTHARFDASLSRQVAAPRSSGLLTTRHTHDACVQPAAVRYSDAAEMGNAASRPRAGEGGCHKPAPTAVDVRAAAALPRPQGGGRRRAHVGCVTQRARTRRSTTAAVCCRSLPLRVRTFACASPALQRAHLIPLQ